MHSRYRSCARRSCSLWLSSRCIVSGAYVPVPGIPFNEFANSFQDSGVSMTMLDLFTGGALSNFSVFSLGIMPYITASIIMQLMQGVIPPSGAGLRKARRVVARSRRSRVT